MIAATSTSIFESFRCGVQACLLEAARHESVWLEVIGPRCRTPEMYPGGPIGRLTGSFGSQIQGALFEPRAILKGWDAKGIESFWYSLMGVERTPYLSFNKLALDTETLRNCPNAKIDRSSRSWLLNAGCIDQDTLNGRWDILRNIFTNVEDVTADEKRVLNLFGDVAIKLDVRNQFCQDGSSIEKFEYVFKTIRRRKWLTLVTKNTSYVITTNGLKALKAGNWLKQYR